MKMRESARVPNANDDQPGPMRAHQDQDHGRWVPQGDQQQPPTHRTRVVGEVIDAVGEDGKTASRAERQRHEREKGALLPTRG